MGIIEFCYNARKNKTNKKALTVLSPSPSLLYMGQRCQRLEGVYTNMGVIRVISWDLFKKCLKIKKEKKITDCLGNGKREI